MTCFHLKYTEFIVVTLICLAVQVESEREDCQDLKSQGQASSGVKTTTPCSTCGEKEVYCDMTTDGGGWTAFQYRKDGSVEFYRTWDEYEQGFGTASTEYWLGNAMLHMITSEDEYELLVLLEDFDGEIKNAKYSTFSIGNAASNYQLTVGGYSGTAGDSLIPYHNGQAFTTNDQDNDKYSINCAEKYHGAWWYRDCHESNLNGGYLNGTHSSYADGMNWETWRGYKYSYKTSKMMIRRILPDTTTTTTTTAGQAPAVTSVTCNGDGTETVVVSKAKDKWVKISECDNEHYVSNNGDSYTIEFTCDIDMNVVHRVVISEERDGGLASDYSVGFKCGSTVSGGPVTAIFVISAVDVDRTTNAFLTGTFSPTIDVAMTDTEGTTVVEASVGDDLILAVKINNIEGFQGVFSIHIIKIIVEAEGKTVILTGGDDNDDDGCKQSELWNVVTKISNTHHVVCNQNAEKVTHIKGRLLDLAIIVFNCVPVQYGNFSKRKESAPRVRFQVFDLFPDAAIAIEHTFTVIVATCENEFFDEETCGMTGCYPKLDEDVEDHRKRRDVLEDPSKVNQYQSSTGLTVKPKTTENENTGGTTASQTGNNESQPVEHQICLRKSVLFGLIGFFVPALILAFAASTCMILRSKKSKRLDEKIVVIERGPYDRKSATSSFRA